MFHLIALYCFLAGLLPADDPFRIAAREEIRAFIERELWGHYDILEVRLVEVEERDGGLGGALTDYDLRAVAAHFRAVRNDHWSEGLNRDLPRQLCEESPQLWLLCRPAGHPLAGTVDLDMVFTTEGWRILSRHHRSLREYPLAGYLRCASGPESADRDVIRDCFGASSR
jgi:hypothetical protein